MVIDMNECKYYAFQANPNKKKSIAVSTLFIYVTLYLLSKKAYGAAFICFILPVIYWSYYYGFPYNNIPWERSTLSISTHDHTVQLLVNNIAIRTIPGDQLFTGIYVFNLRRCLVFSSESADNKREIKKNIKKKLAFCVPYNDKVVNDFPDLFL